MKKLILIASLLILSSFAFAGMMKNLYTQTQESVMREFQAIDYSDIYVQDFKNLSDNELVVNSLVSSGRFRYACQTFFKRKNSSYVAYENSCRRLK